MEGREACGGDTAEGQLPLVAPCPQPILGGLPLCLENSCLRGCQQQWLGSKERPQMSMEKLLKTKHHVTLYPLLLRVHNNPIW